MPIGVRGQRPCRPVRRAFRPGGVLSPISFDEERNGVRAREGRRAYESEHVDILKAPKVIRNRKHGSIPFHLSLIAFVTRSRERSEDALCENNYINPLDSHVTM